MLKTFSEAMEIPAKKYPIVGVSRDGVGACFENGSG